ncbi:MAG: tRNA uridine-5-carboxymethylaminomethyl(34) synthesis GTPase MnmE [Flavobacteriales bacterium]|nr:tRNA uridine-5-carboxymethylaminomethyl(34) synthesis GTPase MnmE [Flavobacteriales bacterium]MCB9447788.1 tRNA uridine-5-carboxymethylaminomethyl(34) synthesis GTPase MnmE [Flavobacteriales bacterium]
MNDTIIAPITGSAASAISVLRISGPKAWEMAAKLTAKKSEWKARTSYFLPLVDETGILDEALITCFRAPASYTGEDVVEISIHGSPYIRQSVLDRLLSLGARMATPGEFTQRAFLNGKMDLSQAEAVADLIAAESSAAHRMAMHQMRGGFKKEIDSLREQLMNFASLIELELDFSEEDVEFADRPGLRQLLEAILEKCTGLAASFRQGNAIREGIPVVIAGKPNAGKSTLLNALLKEERAIVSDIPGTTRDIIEEKWIIGGSVFRLMDTAGLRETTDKIERIGVERAMKRIAQSAMVLYVFDLSQTDRTTLEQEISSLQSSQPALQNGDAQLVLIANKADLCDASHAIEITAERSDCIVVSAQDGEGITDLMKYMESFAQALLPDEHTTLVSNMRHVDALRKTAEAVTRVLDGMDTGLTSELLAADIRTALHHLGSITGAITTEDLLGNIFSKFCIGK